MVISLTAVFILFSLPNEVFAAPCGNGVCQSSRGENSNTCPEDCGAPPQTYQHSICQNNSCVTVDCSPNTSPCSDDCSSDSQCTAGSEPPPDNSGGSDSTEDSSDDSITSDSYPSLNLNAYSPDPTNDTALTFTGSVSVDSGIIRDVEYSFNGDTWFPVSPKDGDFNNTKENFTFTLFSLKEGTYTVLVRGKNSQNAYTRSKNYAKDTFTIVTTPPSVTLAQFAKNPTNNQTPTILAQATSKLAGIQSVQLSTDSGISWQNMRAAGNSYSLTLKSLEDGNYPVQIRAFDTTGNIGSSETQTLIIDTIPPIIGGGLHTVGPQVLIPDTTGLVKIVAGAENTLVLSMKGGVIEAKIVTEEGEFNLESRVGSNIWVGKMKFDSQGKKTLTIFAKDGADNETKRIMNVVAVEDYGHVTSTKNQFLVEGAKVSIYYFQPSSKQWYLWNGTSFGQENPQVSDSKGEYGFMVPPGRYYIEVKSPSFRKTQSEIMDIQKTTILNFDFPLKPKPSIKMALPFFGEVVFSIPTLIPETIAYLNQDNSKSNYTNNESLLPTQTIAPDFALPNLTGTDVNISQYRGKSVLLTFFALWSSPSLEQVSALSELSSQLSENHQLVSIGLQEAASALETFMKRGGYSFQVLADQNGDTAADYRISLLPQHFLIDKNGVIQEVFVGVLSLEEALEKLEKL